MDGLFFVIENIKVKNIIIGYQYEETENFKNFMEIVNSKNINLIIVESGDILKIDQYTKFEILAPFKNEMILENSINNNSVVAKLVFNEISMLFTGDIEEQAEKILVSKYGDNLKSDILKIAHHGSKTSSTEIFLNKVKPKIALIGVGENNSFNHPSIDVINRLKRLRNRNI